MTTGIYHRKDGTWLSYEKEEGALPGIVYFHGLLSCKESKKAQFLKKLALEKGLSYLSFDFSAHGASWGKPWDLTIGRCYQDALDMIENLTSGPQILVGNSMGGWIGLLVSETLKEKITAFVGLAPGPDFTQMIWDTLLTEEHKALLEKGQILGPNAETQGYCFTKALFEDAQKYLMTNRSIAYEGPVILLNGDKDVLVPYERAFKIKDCLQSKEVQIWILKGAEHNLSTPEDLEKLENAINIILMRKG